MKLVPQLNSTGEIEDGSYIRALDFCQRNCNKGRCKTFYNSIMSALLSSGFLTCPYGMSVYVSALEKQIYCSMRERETYNKKLSKNIADARKLYNPVLPAEQLYTLIQASQTITVGKKKLDEKQAVVDSISHEVKKLNGQIKEHSDLAISLLKADDDVTPSPENVAKVYEELRSIFLSSSMIASRYTLFDYEKNPDVLKGTIVETSIHKTFYKLAKIFRNYRKRNIPIILSGSTFRYIDACNGVQREHNKKLNNGLPILHKVPPKRDYGRYFCILAEKGGTSHGGLTEKLSPFFHAKKQEVNAYGR